MIRLSDCLFWCPPARTCQSFSGSARLPYPEQTRLQWQLPSQQADKTRRVQCVSDGSQEVLLHFPNPQESQNQDRSRECRQEARDRAHLAWLQQQPTLRGAHPGWPRRELPVRAEAECDEGEMSCSYKARVCRCYANTGEADPVDSPAFIDKPPFAPLGRRVPHRL